MKKLFLAAMLMFSLSSTFTLVSCRETKSDDIEDVADDVGDKVEDVADDVSDALDDN